MRTRTLVATAALALPLLSGPGAYAATVQPSVTPSASANISCSSNGYIFAYAAHGYGFPANTRLTITLERNSTEWHNAPTGHSSQTTTSLSGTWSSNTFYDNGLGGPGFDETVYAEVTNTYTGAWYATSSVASIPYYDCVPYGPRH